MFDIFGNIRKTPSKTPKKESRKQESSSWVSSRNNQIEDSGMSSAMIGLGIDIVETIIDNTPSFDSSPSVDTSSSYDSSSSFDSGSSGGSSDF